MTGDTILLIGIDHNKINLGQIYETNKYADLVELYGNESIFAEPFRILQNQFYAESISVLNLDAWDDLKDEEELFRQQYYTYIVPLDLRLSDSYNDFFEQKQYLYAQLLTWMTGRSFSTVIMTGLHASSFNTLTEYIAYEQREIAAANGYFYNLQKNNLIYISNGLQNYSQANVILAGMLLNDISQYPSSDIIGNAYWDIDYSDINFDLVWFRNNHLRATTLENLKNFSDHPIIKSVFIDRIVKWIGRNWPDANSYIGTAFSDYKLIKITEQSETFLKSLTGWIISDYKILSVTTEQYKDSSVGIHIRYEITPIFTTEKYVDEVIL